MATYALTVSTNALGLGVLNGAKVRIEKRRVAIADTYPPINNLIQIAQATNPSGITNFLLEPDDLTTYHVAKIFDLAGVFIYEKSFTMPPSAANLHDASISTVIGGSLIQFKENGNDLGTPTSVRNVDIVGSGVDATFAGDTLTIDAGRSNAASQIFDESGETQQKINDNARINNVKSFGAVGTNSLVSSWYTAGSANYRNYLNLAAVKVDYPFIVDGTESIDYAGFQAAVNFAISNGSNRIFIPFDNAEKYFLNRTVIIPASGFDITGNRTPSYHIHLRGGYIFADATVTDVFNYGVGDAYDSNQLTIEGIAALGQGNKTQNFVKHDANNNGPHRGVLIRKCSGRGFNNFIELNPTNEAYLSAANVVVESGCCFAGNNNVVNAVQRLFGMRVSGVQSEQGARYTGAIDGGVTIVDNMLEGQSNPITIDSNQPSVIIQNNYFELISGDYLSKTKGTNPNALFDERPNYISSVSATDIHRLSGVVRLHAPYRYHMRDDRHSLYSLIGVNLAIGSKFDGAAYIGTTDSTDGAAGFCDPLALRSARLTAKFNKFVGSDTLDTPTGKTYTGLKSTGTSGYVTISNGNWDAGDVVTAVALVKIPDNEEINMSVYANTGELIGAVGQNTMFKMAEGWHIVFISRAASVASTTTRFRFTSTQQIEVASVGVDVTPVADFKIFNGVQRAEIQLFNPLPLNAETHTYKDTSTLTIPAIAAGASHITTAISVYGAAIGDAVVCSPDVDMQGLDWFARVSATHIIELRIVNRTGTSVTLGTVQWITKVFK